MSEYPPRWLIAVVLPVAMVVGFISVIFREIGRAFKYAWLEAMIEFQSGKRSWKREGNA